MVNLLDLPAEMLGEIFAYLWLDLPYVRFVCRRFNELARKMCDNCPNCVAYNQFVVSRGKLGYVEYCNFVVLPTKLHRHAFNRHVFIDYLLRNNYTDVFELMRMPVGIDTVQSAVLHNHMHYVTDFLNKNKGSIDENNQSHLLFLSTIPGNIETVKYLFRIFPGYDIDEMLRYSVWYNHFPLAKWLIECGAKPCDDVMDCCIEGFMTGNDEMFQYIINKFDYTMGGPDRWKVPDLILHTADLNRIKYLHEEEGIPMPTRAPGMWSIYQNLEVVKYLHTRSVPMNMYSAISAGNLDVIKYLHQYYSIDDSHFTFVNSPKVMKYLWSHHTPSNITSLLGEVIRGREFEMIKTIVNLGKVTTIDISQQIVTKNIPMIIYLRGIAKCTWSDSAFAVNPDMHQYLFFVLKTNR